MRLLLPQLGNTAGHATYISTAGLSLSAFLVAVGTSNRHALTTSAVAWLSICTFACLASKGASLTDITHPRALAWAAGSLLALANICERSVNKGDIWWAKVNCPLETLPDSD